jgi:protein phosphatase
MKLTIPEFSLVVLVGASGSGKSHFAQKVFKRTEVISSDYCRGLVSDDENDQAATKDAFDVLKYIAAKRLAGARLTVIDATNVQMEARKPLLALALQYHCLAIAIVLNLPEGVCVDRNKDRPDRNFGRRVVAQQRSQLRRSMRGLRREGFRYVYGHHRRHPRLCRRARRAACPTRLRTGRRRMELHPSGRPAADLPRRRGGSGAADR